AQLPEGGCLPEQVLRVAEADGRPVGFLWIGPGQQPGLAWVNDVEVEPDLRGRGYGRALMHEAERLAAGLGYARVGLNVMAGNPVAIALYDSLGYELMTQQMAKPL